MPIDTSQATRSWGTPASAAISSAENVLATGPSYSGSEDAPPRPLACEDRKSTRLNSSHVRISYAVFCLKKKTEERGNGRSARAAPRDGHGTFAHAAVRQVRVFCLSSHRGHLLSLPARRSSDLPLAC